MRHGCRIGTSALRKGKFFRAGSPQQPRKAVVSFDAPRLVINSVVLVALLGELLADGPPPGPHGRIFKSNCIFERSRAGPRPTLHQMQVFARPLKISFRTEVGYVDDEGIALPMAPRVTVPLADIGWQVRTPVHDDVALPPWPWFTS